MSENRFFNRELSWLEFNARVLHQGLRKELPLLERLQFLSIVTSNFDEFFQVRVASVKRTFFDKPDFKKFPALKNAKGYICNLNHGEMLYMPEGYWHYMKYITPGFSMSLRALPRNPKYLLKAAYNVFIMRHFDNFMRKRKGQAWIDEKNDRAIKETHKRLNIHNDQ